MSGWRWGRPTRDPRWVVLDVETSGLDPQACDLLAVAALAVHIDERGRARIVIGDSFEAVLRREPAGIDRSNILLHGIGVAAQRAGGAPREVLQAFAAWVADAPLLGFHVAFDRRVIERQLKILGLPALAPRWLDIEPLAAVLRHDVRARSLDEWMAALGVHCATRHRAASDALATAELLLKLWTLLAKESPDAARGGFDAAQRLAAGRRWLVS